MSTLRRSISSRANGAKSHGPTSPEGKARSSQNATTHGLFAECILLNGEDHEAFDELMQYHKDRFQPADGVEFDIVKQICAAQWRLYRVLAMETQALNRQIATQPAGPCPYYLADAFEAAAALPSMALLQRHESRLQLVHQRAIRSLKLLRTIDLPSPGDGPNEIKMEPSPINEHPAPDLPNAADLPNADQPDSAPEAQPAPQPPDSESLGSPNFTVRGFSALVRPTVVSPAAKPLTARPSAAPSPKQSGAAG